MLCVFVVFFVVNAYFCNRAFFLHSLHLKQKIKKFMQVSPEGTTSDRAVR